MGTLLFVSDAEACVWLWRKFSEFHDERALLLARHADYATALEQVLKQSCKWRIVETEIREQFESLLETRADVVRSSLEGVSFYCGGERESGWLNESVGITVHKRDKELEKPPKDIHLQLVLLTSLLSVCIDQRCPISATTLLSSLCGAVLPALKRRAAAAGLTLMQTVTSLIAQNASGSTDAAAFAKHIGVLKDLDECVDNVHETISDIDDPFRALSASIQHCSAFLVNSDAHRCCGRVKQAQRVLTALLKECAGNEAVSARRPVDYQKVPSFVNSRERVCRALVDRVTCLDLLQPDADQVAVFKTPLGSTQAQSQSASPRSAADTDHQPDTQTPEQKRIASFVNNSTPTPIRSDIPSQEDLFDLQPLEAEKEGEEENAKESCTPQRPPKPAGLRASFEGNKRRSTESGQPAKRLSLQLEPKSKTAAKPAAAKEKKKKVGKTPMVGQKSITSFFR